MTRTVYVNGDYLPEGEAKVSIFDRGFLMADGVYEVTSVLDGKLIDFRKGREIEARQLVDELLDWTAPSRSELGIEVELPAMNGTQRALEATLLHREIALRIEQVEDGLEVLVGLPLQDRHRTVAAGVGGLDVGGEAARGLHGAAVVGHVSNPATPMVRSANWSM